MITKHMTGRSFSGCLHYVLEKPGARVMGGNLFSVSPESANAELTAVAARSRRIVKPLLHCALSLAPGESLDDDQWRRLSRDYLQALGLGRSQYLLVRHTDTPTHEHVHLVVNRVMFSGKSVSLSWDFMRAQTLVRQLATAYGLSQVPMSWEKRPLGMALSGGARARASVLPALPAAVERRLAWQERLRVSLNSSLATASDLPSLLRELQSQAVEARLTYRQGKATGISFELEGERIGGARLGQAYSLPRLVKALGMQQVAVSDEVASQFEPDVLLPVYHQRYLELAAGVGRHLGRQASQRTVDLAVARIALRSQDPAEGRALLYSPDVQALLKAKGEEAAQEYMRVLMLEAWRRLNPVQPTEQRQEQERA